MGTIVSSFRRDANQVPIWSKGLIVTKTIAYDGTAGKGAAGATTLFTVTGDALVTVLASCTEDLASGGGTIEVGISGNTAALIAQTTATTIDSGEIWNDASPATVEAFSNNSERIIVGGTDIIETVATADVTNGTLKYYCVWVPLSDDADIVAT